MTIFLIPFQAKLLDNVTPVCLYILSSAHSDEACGLLLDHGAVLLQLVHSVIHHGSVRNGLTEKSISV